MGQHLSAFTHGVDPRRLGLDDPSIRPAAGVDHAGTDVGSAGIERDVHLGSRILDDPVVQRTDLGGVGLEPVVNENLGAAIEASSVYHRLPAGML